jgi:hypothetical protein
MMSPRFLHQMTSCDVASNVWQAIAIARQGIQRIFHPSFLSNLACHDSASDMCQALALGAVPEFVEKFDEGGSRRAAVGSEPAEERSAGAAPRERWRR